MNEEEKRLADKYAKPFEEIDDILDELLEETKKSLTMANSLKETDSITQENVEQLHLKAIKIVADITCIKRCSEMVIKRINRIPLEDIAAKLSQIWIK